MAPQSICLGMEENLNCHQEVHKNFWEVNIKLRVVLKDIAKSLDTMGISINTHTIQHCLNRNGLYGNWPWRTPSLQTILHCRLVWFCQVLWSDERKIELFQRNDVQKIWCKKGKAFFPKETVPTLKYGGGSMMFLGPQRGLDN